VVNPNQGATAVNQQTQRHRARRGATAAALLGVFGLALLLRLVYLHQVWSIPFFEFPLVDARSYDEWAQRIAAGDWWGDRVFYQAPAYPYFLAAIYRLAGHELWTAHVVQMVMGSASCVLMFLTTRLLFGPAAGLTAGLLLTCYAPALFFDGIQQKTSLGLFLTNLLLFLLASSQVGHPPRPAQPEGEEARGRDELRPGRTALTFGGCGLVLGLLTLTRENALLFAAAIPLWLTIRFRDLRPATRLLWAAAFLAGLLLVLVPVGLRNYSLGSTFALTTSQMGPNFYIGNNPDATGLYAPLLPGRHTPDFESTDATKLAERALGRKLDPGEVSRYWMGRGFEFIRQQPGRWLQLTAHKALLTFNEFEVPDTEDIYVYAESSSLLRALLYVLHFGTLLPLAAAGWVLAWPQRRQAWFLYLLTAVFASGVIVFYVWSRYRSPLIPLLIPFAALALVRGVALLRRRDWGGLWTPGAALLLAAVVANYPLLDEKRFRVAAYTNLGNIMLQRERYDEAEPYLLQAAEFSADNADLQFHLAVLRFQQHRYPEAEQHLERMLELDDTDFRAPRLMALVLRRQGRMKEARAHWLEAIRLHPNLKPELRGGRFHLPDELPARGGPDRTGRPGRRANPADAGADNGEED
jgi:tetratricopeptide (TPR) repeat protein